MRVVLVLILLNLPLPLQWVPTLVPYLERHCLQVQVHGHGTLRPRAVLQRLIAPKVAIFSRFEWTLNELPVVASSFVNAQGLPMQEARIEQGARRKGSSRVWRLVVHRVATGSRGSLFAAAGRLQD